MTDVNAEQVCPHGYIGGYHYPDNQYCGYIITVQAPANVNPMSTNEPDNVNPPAKLNGYIDVTARNGNSTTVPASAGEADDVLANSEDVTEPVVGEDELEQQILEAITTLPATLYIPQQGKHYDIREVVPELKALIARQRREAVEQGRQQIIDDWAAQMSEPAAKRLREYYARAEHDKREGNDE